MGIHLSSFRVDNIGDGSNSEHGGSVVSMSRKTTSLDCGQQNHQRWNFFRPSSKEPSLYVALAFIIVNGSLH